ncbi:MAG: carbohydrate ABC transporter permease [bacterium]|nr:carbohydrate ABC transporter permease [bacterium]
MLLHKTRGDKIFDVVNIILMVLVCAAMLYPFLYVVGSSVMTEEERALRPFALFPRNMNWDGYRYLLTGKSLLYTGYIVTIARTVIGTVLSVLVEAMFGYSLSQKKLPYRNFFTIMVAVTMWFSGGLIPTFLVVRTVGIYDTFWALILPKLMIPFNIFIFRSFFSQIPDSLKESAEIDGANELQVFWKIILPLSTAVIATMALFHVVTYWNEWFHGVVFIKTDVKQPVQVVLRQILAQAEFAELFPEEIGPDFTPPTRMMQMAMIVIVTFPIVVAYPFFQKYFVKGMMVGSVKG